MHYRELGQTGWKVSEISFGAWAIGGSWGQVDDTQSLGALHAAIDAGVNLIDTADVYGMGRSERLIAQLRRERRGETIYVATKAGRRLPQQTPQGYSRDNLDLWVDDSLRHLETDALDLLQLHCPPTDAYYRPEIFEAMDRLVECGKIRHYGVSVERVEEALKAIAYPNVKTVQIIFNCFRQRPAELFLPQARERKIGVLARVPLASGLLTGKLRRDTRFDAEDHRHFNRHGEQFDAGETFSGVDYAVALEAVEELRTIIPTASDMAAFALRWILMFDAVSCAIPGGKNAAQVWANCTASDTPAVNPEQMEQVAKLYRTKIAPLVHQRW